jgi:hypothetical protein
MFQRKFSYPIVISHDEGYPLPISQTQACLDAVLATISLYHFKSHFRNFYVAITRTSGCSELDGVGFAHKDNLLRYFSCNPGLNGLDEKLMFVLGVIESRVKEDVNVDLASDTFDSTHQPLSK